MATIRKVQNKSGVTYRAQIILKANKKVTHSESQTFKKMKEAKDWAAARETELKNIDIFKYQKEKPLLIRDLIKKYIEEYEIVGRTKLSDLRAIAKRDIGGFDAKKLDSTDLVLHVRRRNKECQPQTAANDLIWLSVVFKAMSAIMHNFKPDLQEFEKAREALRMTGMIGKSGHRDRRPTKEEITKIMRYLRRTDKRVYDIMLFAIFSARRISEICRLQWDDLRDKDRTIIVRDLKDPRKRGLIKISKLPKLAYKIIMRQPRVSYRIFPYNSKTMAGYYANACKILGIEDLHFHDFRHEATSRLFEDGLLIQQVQQVTLHSQWSTLQRYTNLRPGDIDI